MTPGTQPQSVSKKTINNEPHPWSITAKGGKMIASKTLNSDITYAISISMFSIRPPCSFSGDMANF